MNLGFEEVNCSGGVAQGNRVFPSPACGRRWRDRASKTPVFRRAMAPDEGRFSLGTWPRPHPDPLPAKRERGICPAAPAAARRPIYKNRKSLSEKNESMLGLQI